MGRVKSVKSASQDCCYQVNSWIVDRRWGNRKSLYLLTYTMVLRKLVHGKPLVIDVPHQMLVGFSVGRKEIRNLHQFMTR